MNSKNNLLHRLKEIRELAKVSLRSISRRSGIPIRTLKHQEKSNNIRLLDLVKWRDALGVPLTELFRDTPDRTDEIIKLRAGLIQIMRAVNSLRHSGLTEQQEAIVQNMSSDLQNVMPELSAIGSWPQSGSRRRDDPARVETQIIATAMWCPDIGNEV